MREYYTLEVKSTGTQTEIELNRLSKDGWRVVCSYAKNGSWLILERNIKITNV